MTMIKHLEINQISTLNNPLGVDMSLKKINPNLPIVYRLNFDLGFGQKLILTHNANK